MKKDWPYLSTLLLLAMLSTACLDVVELALPSEDGPGSYIVEGLITQGKGPHHVQVSRVTPIGIRNNIPADLAEIWVENNHGQREDLAFLGEGLFE
ncbi:MAG: hypothetical protein AAFN10_29175, partial [Bacteroidota bacterium]